MTRSPRGEKPTSERFAVSATACRNAASLLVALLGATPLAGQGFRGIVVEENTRQPVAGGLLQLLGARSDSLIVSTASNERGRFGFGNLRPGEYRLRVLRIGFRAWTSEPFRLGAGQAVDTTLVVPVVPIVLDELVVESQSPCRRSPEEDRRMALLWDEARKTIGLAGTVAGDSLEFLTLYTRRSFDVAGRVTHEEQYRVYDEGRWPVTTQSPDSLAAAGYVQPRDSLSGPVYYGPDAAAFFSDGFLDTHCFRLIPPGKGHPGQVGVGFEPVRGRTLPDIKGVLWIDRRSHVLAALEYKYVNLWRWVQDGSAEGSLEFARLGSGQVVISAWKLRAPIPNVDPTTSARDEERTRRFFGSGRIRMFGVREESGVVQEVRGAGGVLVWPPGHPEPGP